MFRAAQLHSGVSAQSMMSACKALSGFHNLFQVVNMAAECSGREQSDHCNRAASVMPVASARVHKGTAGSAAKPMPGCMTAQTVELVLQVM